MITNDGKVVTVKLKEPKKLPKCGRMNSKTLNGNLAANNGFDACLSKESSCFHIAVVKETRNDFFLFGILYYESMC